MLLARLLALFVLVPLVELALLIEVGRRFGTVNTVLLIVVTGTLGAMLAKQQGLSALKRVRGELDRGEVPASAVADGLLILSAGVLLITPGILTDIVGFSLLIPWVRTQVKSWLLGLFSRWAAGGGRFTFVRRRH